jgi:hypothetical protein
MFYGGWKKGASLPETCTPQNNAKGLSIPDFNIRKKDVSSIK